MKTYLGFVAISVFLLSCTNTDRDNPFDERASNYIGNAFVGGSSSSVKAGDHPSSSSVVYSSSSVKPSSSSAPPSSSSVVPSSSSSFVSQNGVVYGTPVDYEGQTYQTVVIGTQTWMAKNLNYNATGSKCYGGVDSNCNTYGRLSDWSTAMGFGSSCNSNTCSSQVQPNHRGVCPPGWHIPSEVLPFYP
jgi:hypothetical protein